MFPGNGLLFVSSLAGRCLARLVLDGSNRVVAEERLLKDLNARYSCGERRTRWLAVRAHDGADGKILWLVKKG